MINRKLLALLPLLALAGCGSFAQQSEVDQIAAERDNLQNEVELLKSVEMELAKRVKTVEVVQKYQLEADATRTEGLPPGVGRAVTDPALIAELETPQNPRQAKAATPKPKQPYWENYPVVDWRTLCVNPDNCPSPREVMNATNEH